MPGRTMAGTGGTAVALLAAAALCAAPAAADPAPGGSGVGDQFFPRAGNGGYDVAHYDLRLDYRPGRRLLNATATISATAIQDLGSFHLDYRGPRIRKLRVDGTPADYQRQGQELVVEPSTGVSSGQPLTVVVAYRGHPHNIRDADHSKDGWIPTDDGAFVAGEPQGAPTWFPCNDHPTDKASFAIRITVPRGFAAISNGALVDRKRRGRSATWSWRQSEPMAAYLATATIGRFAIERGRAGGVPSLVAVDPRQARQAKRPLAKLPKIVGLFQSLFGPYPFAQVGAIVDDAPDVGYALETQTRPIFDRAPNSVTLAHEIAHQWFGDSVSLERWQDMWLNEGFATWAEWRWVEQRGGRTTAEQFADLIDEPASASLWNPPPGSIPGPAELFADSVYVRGAMALEALREQIGDPAFYATLRDWASAHAYSNATIEDFIALAEARSNQQLDGLFQTWLYDPGKPERVSAPVSGRPLTRGGWRHSR